MTLHWTQPPGFLNVGMVEYLRRSTGYTWDEIARSMLVSRTTIWRKLKEAGITMERYSNISDADLDNPHCGQVLLRSLDTKDTCSQV